MKPRQIIFWLATGLLAVGMTISGVAAVLRTGEVRETAAELGMPLSALVLLGILKLLGVVALLLPQAGRLNEWAYAGFAFDFLGAFWLHLGRGHVGEGAAAVVAGLVLLISYLTKPYTLRLVRRSILRDPTGNQDVSP